MLMKDKIIFDRYYCINSALYSTTSSHFHMRKKLSFACSFRVEFSYYEHVLCVAPGNGHN